MCYFYLNETLQTIPNKTVKDR